MREKRGKGNGSFRSIRGISVSEADIEDSFFN